MKRTSIIFIVLAILAAALGIWVVAGIAAWIIRILAVVFLVMALLALRKKVISK